MPFKSLGIYLVHFMHNLFMSVLVKINILILQLTVHYFWQQIQSRQWSSQGLPGWASCPPGEPKWGRKWEKFEENKKKISTILGKNEESGTLAYPWLWGWLRPWVGLLHDPLPNYDILLNGFFVFVCLFVFFLFVCLFVFCYYYYFITSN